MKLFHSWKRWQLIALVCVVLTAVLTLVFVLQGGSGDTQPTGGTEGLQLATETLGDVTEPPETAAPTEKPTAASTEATEASTEASTEATKATEAPTAATQPATEAPTEPPATEPAAPSCTVSISCTTVLDNWDKLSEAKRSIVPSNGIILGTVTVELQEGDTVFSVLQRVVSDYNIQMEYSVSPLYQTTYIEGLGNLYEKDCGARSGWMFVVNGVFPNYGASDCTVQDVIPSAGCIPATSAATFPEYRLPCGASRTGCAAFCVLRHCRGAASSTSREAPADRYREHEKSKRSRFVIARSEATWQSREGTYSSYRPSLKQRATIVSAAALPERHGD